jgi:transcription initiation factor TFIIIB Brf1 subunit/transcription initiation factor TFIIB
MRCPECGSIEFNTTHIEIHCRHCGYILEDDLIESQNFIFENNPAKIPAMATAGGKLESYKRIKGNWLYTSKEKKTDSLLATVDFEGGKLHLPKFVITDAQIMIKDLQEKDYLRGRDATALIVASLYASCLNNGIVRTHLDFELKCNVSRAKVLKYYKILAKSLNLPQKKLNVEDVIEYYGHKLNLNGQIIVDAQKLTKKLNNLVLQCHVIATSCLYKSCVKHKYPLTQRKLAYVSGVHEVSLRKVLKSL